MNIHRHSRCHYKRNSGSTPAGTNNPPHRRACGMTNSRWLAAARSVRSDNDLRSGWLNSSSDDLRADAAATRPSPASPLEGRGQAIKAEEPEVSPRGGGGSRRWRNLLRLPPPQRRRQAVTCPPADPHSSPPGWTGTDPHAEASCRSEDKTIQEHERRPSGVRCPGRSLGAHDATTTRTEGRQPHSTPAVGGGTESCARAS
jgi:hypothetical protein